MSLSPRDSSLVNSIFHPKVPHFSSVIYCLQRRHSIHWFLFSTTWFIACKQDIPSCNRMIYLTDDQIFQNLWFLSGFPWQKVAANKKAPESRFPIYWLYWSHHFECFSVGTMAWLAITEYLCCILRRLYSICRRYFPVHSWLITGSVTREIRWVPPVE